MARLTNSAIATAGIALTAIVAPAAAQTPGDPTPFTVAQTEQAGAGASSATSTRAQRTFSSDEMVGAAERFFGETSLGIAQAVQRVFAEEGEPTGYIEGEEFSGALGAGLRYGRGTLYMRNGDQRTVYWQGPSIGFDTGANASKVFTLVYDLGNAGGIYRRYPGVEGAAFFVAGASVTYQRAEGVTLAPIRTGVGLRLGANAGYTAYSMNRRWLPF